MSFASTSSLTMNLPHPSNFLDRRIDLSLSTLPQFVDGIGDRYRLSAEQRHELHEALRFGSDVSPGDLILRVTAQAQLFQMRNEMFEMKNEIFKLNTTIDTMVRKGDGTESVLKDVRVILTKWELSPGQKTNLIAVTKNFVSSATITSYETLDTAVKEELRLNGARYGFSDVFDKPDRANVVKKEVGSQCRSIKNQYRVHILHSIDNRPTSLAETVQFLYRKYKMEVNLPNAPAEFTARVALLRRFARENINYLRMESPSTDLNETDLPYGRKRQRTEVSEEPETITRRGRVSKENSFWYRFDKFLSEKLTKFGDDLASAEWKEYITETLLLDGGLQQQTPAPL